MISFAFHNLKPRNVVRMDTRCFSRYGLLPSSTNSSLRPLRLRSFCPLNYIALQNLESFALVECLYRRRAAKLEHSMTSKIAKYLATIVLGSALICQAAEKKSDKADAKAKPYPLKPSSVTAEKLVEM